MPSGPCFGVCDAGVWSSEADRSGNNALCDGKECSMFLFCVFKIFFKARQFMIKQAHKKRFCWPFCNCCVSSRAWTRPVVPPRLTGLAWIGSRLAHLADKPRMLLSRKLDAHCRESVSVSPIRCRWHSPNPFELRLRLGLTVPYIKSVPTGLALVTVLFIFV